MTRHTAASTEWIITSWAAAALEAEATAEVVICEHTPADALAYLLAAIDHRSEHLDPDDLRYLNLLTATFTARNTLVLATQLDPADLLGEHPGKDPGYADEQFRMAVDEHLHRLLSELKLAHQLVSVGGGAEAVHSAVAAAMKALAS